MALDGPPDFGVDEYYEVNWSKEPLHGAVSAPDIRPSPDAVLSDAMAAFGWRERERGHDRLVCAQVRKMLGEGGSGQTWLCLDRRQRKSVAVKFIRRPVPKVMLPMLMHEIKVSSKGMVDSTTGKGVHCGDAGCWRMQPRPRVLLAPAAQRMHACMQARSSVVARTAGLVSQPIRAPVPYTHPRARTPAWV